MSGPPNATPLRAARLAVVRQGPHRRVFVELGGQRVDLRRSLDPLLPEPAECDPWIGPAPEVLSEELSLLFGAGALWLRDVVEEVHAWAGPGRRERWSTSRDGERWTSAKQPASTEAFELLDRVRNERESR